MEPETVERLMETLLQMRINLAHIADTFQQQTVEIRDQLKRIFDQEKRELDQCVRRIDEKLEECSVQLEHYQALYASLVSMQHKLILLGAEDVSLPEPLPARCLDEVVAWRLRELKGRGKI
ncbi:MAG TPA: hypothetical protein VNN77_15760 [candidate division Zixibacteria bacterium]|nr:hypothetical protein [candidate division Zixibacteria bacterium]